MSLNKGAQLKDTFLLTDTLPGEIPIIYSNFSLYDYILTNSNWDNITSINDKQKFLGCTIPYYFNIKKNTHGFRQIGLIHPVSQLLITKFNFLYDKEIVEYFQINSDYSLRHPKAIIRQKKIPFELNPSLLRNWINKVVKFYYGYKYVKITDFYNSQEFLNNELKFSILYKIDIQSFFDSIYTHSLEWAYLGNKELAKKNKNTISNLGGLIDNIFQSMNYGETNGIVVGPEFSRIVSEIISTRVDSEVKNELVKRNIHISKDYNIRRFLDDIFIYSNEEKTCDLIKEIYEEKLLVYKLRLNIEKTKKEIRPFHKEHLWVRFSYRLVQSIEQWYHINKSLFQKNNYRLTVKFRNDIIQDLKYIIAEYPKQSSYIISYVITSLSSIIKNRSYSNINEKIESFFQLEAYNYELGKNHYIHRIKVIFEIMQYALTISPNYKNITNFTSACFKINNVLPDFERFIFHKAELLLESNMAYFSEISNIVLFLATLRYDLSESILLSCIENEKSYFNISIISYYLTYNKREYKYNKIVQKINEIIDNKIDDIKYNFPISSKGKYDTKILSNLLSDQLIIWLLDYYTCPLISIRVTKKIDKIFNWINNSINDIEQLYPLQYIFGKFIVEKKQPFMKWNLSAEEIKNEILRRIKNKINSIY